MATLAAAVQTKQRERIPKKEDLKEKKKNPQKKTPSKKDETSSSGSDTTTTTDDDDTDDDDDEKKKTEQKTRVPLKSSSSSSSSSLSSSKLSSSTTSKPEYELYSLALLAHEGLFSTTIQRSQLVENWVRCCRLLIFVSTTMTRHLKMRIFLPLFCCQRECYGKTRGCTI